MSRSLYSLTKEMKEIEELASEIEEYDEDLQEDIKEEIEEKRNQLLKLIEDKIDSTIYIMKNKKSYISELEAEKRSFDERIKAEKRSLESLNNNVLNVMRMKNINKIEIVAGKLERKISKTTQVVKGFDLSKLDEKYQRVKTKIELEAKVARKDIEAGLKVDGVFIQETEKLTLK